MLTRAPRSTNCDLVCLEARQSIIIDELAQAGDLEIAARLARCQYDRQHRPQGWPWRCRSAGGCLLCYRSKALANWRGFRLWLADSSVETSVATVPLHGDPLAAIRRLRKGLRDVRDRAVVRTPDWRDVAMGGLIGGDTAVVLIRHHAISRTALWSILGKRWPDVHVSAVGETMPSLTIDTGLMIALARKRRGLEPVRIILPPQAPPADVDFYNDPDGPMPFLF